MANTYSRIYLHLVFAVKGRANLISKNWKDELYKYISGIINAKGQKLYIINGVADHIHILVSVSPDTAISNLTRDIKANSSRFINEKGFIKGKFQWQEGFGVFSVSYDHLQTVVNYIKNQEQHHHQQSFREEYYVFLKNYEIQFDEKYVFDFMEEHAAPDGA